MAANPPYIHFALMRWRCSEIRILLRLLREGGMKMYITLDDLIKVLNHDMQIALLVFELIALMVILYDHFKR